MIVYLDTSSLVKLYVRERWSDEVVVWAEAADALATSRVTLPEAASALARLHRRGEIRRDGLRRSLADLADAWREYLVVDVHERWAAELAVRHVLWGFDAVHLAAALTLRDAVGDDGVAFSTFDAALNEAAAAEGLIVLEAG